MFINFVHCNGINIHLYFVKCNTFFDRPKTKVKKYIYIYLNLIFVMMVATYNFTFTIFQINT